MRAALRAEWIKLRTVRSTRWNVVAIVASVVVLTAFFAGLGHTDAGAAGQGDDDVVANSLRGVYLGEIAVVALGAIAFTSEHATRLIGTTLTAMPRRGVVLAAKAAAVSAVAFAAALVACVVSFLVAQPLLHRGNFVPPAYPLVSLTDPPVVRAVLGSALFLTALALLGLGAAAVLRHATAVMSLLLGLLLVPTVLGGLLPSSLIDPLRRATPSAGLAVQATVDRADNVPIGPWAGLGVSWAWAVGALLLAWLVLERRDA
jgi:ABC-2 type transport system permease protein